MQAALEHVGCSSIRRTAGRLLRVLLGVRRSFAGACLHIAHTLGLAAALLALFTTDVAGASSFGPHCTAIHLSTAPAGAAQVIEAELGVPWGAVFSSLSASPVAAASLGQVYKGSLASNGAEVAVKVRGGAGCCGEQAAVCCSGTMRAELAVTGRGGDCVVATSMLGALQCLLLEGRSSSCELHVAHVQRPGVAETMWLATCP
jgi:hypothetical protein